jgi:biotin operon repressor
VLFERRLREGIRDGTVSLAFRRWRRCQVVAGRRYRTGLGLTEVAAVDLVREADIDAGQARAAGYDSVGELRAGLRGDPELPLYRIRFRRVNEPDPRDVLAAGAALSPDELATLGARLDRMDAASERGPWTAAVLGWIAAHPATSSAVLAAALDWPRPDLKLRIRRLKELGLTISLDVGYRLSPRGEAYLRAAGRTPAASGRSSMIR